MQDQAASLRKLVENKKDSAAADSGTDAAREAPEPSAARPVPKEGARIIAVTSGKGGVGKSNLTVNLALAFLAEGKKTLVIDADLGMANVDVLLGTSSKYNLLHLLDEDVVLDDVILKGPYGLRYISGGSGMEQAGGICSKKSSRAAGNWPTSSSSIQARASAETSSILSWRQMRCFS